MRTWTLWGAPLRLSVRDSASAVASMRRRLLFSPVNSFQVSSMRPEMLSLASFTWPVLLRLPAVERRAAARPSRVSLAPLSACFPAVFSTERKLPRKAVLSLRVVLRETVTLFRSDRADCSFGTSFSARSRMVSTLSSTSVRLSRRSLVWTVMRSRSSMAELTPRRRAATSPLRPFS